MKRIRKTIYQGIVASALTVLAIGTMIIAMQLVRLNQLIEWIRSEVPMSMLGN